MSMSRIGPHLGPSSRSALPASPALLPLLGSAAILSFDYWEFLYFSTFLRASRAEIPDAAVAHFWSRSLTPALGSVLALYGGTAALGTLAWRGAEPTGLLRQYAGMGTLFTLGHFAYGYVIANTVQKFVHDPENARPGMKQWLSIHAVRTLTMDIPAFVCFLTAVLHGW